jgi:hypothetical protein
VAADDPDLLDFFFEEREPTWGGDLPELDSEGDGLTNKFPWVTLSMLYVRPDKSFEGSLIEI